MEQTTAEDWAVRQAALDEAEIRARIGVQPYNFQEERALLVDGSMFSPAWRALAGGAAVYRRASLNPGIGEVYQEALDNLLDGLPVYWEEGCLFYSRRMQTLMEWRPK